MGGTEWEVEVGKEERSDQTGTKLILYYMLSKCLASFPGPDFSVGPGNEVSLCYGSIAGTFSCGGKRKCNCV